MQKPSKEQIKTLLKNGFDPELMAFELKIPIEEIELIKKELEQNNIAKNKNTTPKVVNRKRELSAHEKFEIMRARYKKLYFDVEQGQEIDREEASKEEREKIDKSITKIQEILASLNEEITENQKMIKAFAILKEIKSINRYQFSIEQAEKIISVLQSTQVQSLKIKNYNDRMQYSTLYNRTKGHISKKYIQAIDIAQSKTNDIEELKYLKQKIDCIPFKEYKAVAEGIKIRINLKIQKDPQKIILNKLKSDIPENILEIVRALSKGTLDIESANAIINEEAKRRVESRVQNKFTLTEEQERNQILFQIRTALEERVEQYPITNPEVTISQLHNLCGDSEIQSLSSVIENLINSKSFETAKKVYAKFETARKTDEYSYNIVSIKKRIRNAEIGDIVLRGIKSQGNTEQDDNYFKLIEKGLKTGNVNMRAISLGKSHSGLRNITLDDVWPDKKKERVS